MCKKIIIDSYTDDQYVLTDHGLKHTLGNENEVLSGVVTGPTADFTATPLTGYHPLSVQYTDQSTSSSGIITWAWDFGDSQTSTEKNPEHVYSYPGYFEVKLTVTDASGTDTVIKQDYVKVNAVGSVQKLFYITVQPSLKTWDFGGPENRLDIRIAIARGSAGYLFYEDSNGVRPYIPSDTINVFGSGFKRPEGPTLIFD